jgi:molybdopterin-guanine dinucleotide biosynthesis protein B
MQVITVVGPKKSGKTTTIEKLIREFTKRGYKVAAIKHISEENFTIDSPGKDTWRFASAGAKTIISVARYEVAKIEKRAKKFTFEALLKECNGNDLVFIEGFKKMVSRNREILKIAIVKSLSEAQDILKNYVSIIAFTGPYDTSHSISHIQYISVQKNAKKLADIVEKVYLKN